MKLSFERTGIELDRNFSFHLPTTLYFKKILFFSYQELFEF